MLENIIIFLFIALGVMSLAVMFLAFWNMRLQDENDRLKIENIGNAPPF